MRDTRTDGSLTGQSRTGPRWDQPKPTTHRGIGRRRDIGMVARPGSGYERMLGSRDCWSQRAVDLPARSSNRSIRLASGPTLPRGLMPNPIPGTSPRRSSARSQRALRPMCRPDQSRPPGPMNEPRMSNTLIPRNRRAATSPRGDSDIACECSLATKGSTLSADRDVKVQCRVRAELPGGHDHSHGLFGRVTVQHHRREPISAHDMGN